MTAVVEVVSFTKCDIGKYFSHGPKKDIDIDMDENIDIILENILNI